MQVISHLFRVSIPVWFLAVSHALAQGTLHIYTDGLVNGFQDWSWASRNLANTSPVHAGAKSISVSASAWQGLSFHQNDFDLTLYTNLAFWAHGGSGGGQRLQIYVDYGSSSAPAYAISALSANTWQQFTIPISSLGVATKTNVNRITFQLTSSGTSGTFYIDDVQLTPKPAPLLVRLNVNAAQKIRLADGRWFGINAAIWDSNFDTSQTVSLLNEMGTKILRFPGGSLSDEYHWASNKTLSNTWTWVTSFSKFVHVATNVGAQAFITVNYGTGTAAEAAGWVRHSNITNNYGFKYWEIGNENYGTWETDSNTYPHDAYTYAVRAKDYLQQMKAADPTIKVGVVVVPGEESYSNGYTNHPAVNSRTAQTHYGWTPVLLTTLKNLGVTPDFAVHHFYPEYTAQESDPLLLQASANWARDATDLRQQITDYFGTGGTNIELVCTENNSNAGAQGRQSTSLVNGLYFADSFGQLMKTELNAFVWWDLRNGTDTSGSMDSTLYGWRNYGDLGMINSLTNRHPTFYAAKLMQNFARGGDTILNGTSDSLLLSAYAARRTNGTLSFLVINKNPSAPLNGQITLTNFMPFTNATIRSYGIAQDEAARTNAAWSAQDVAVTNFSMASSNFNFSFPAYSLTLFSFAPGPARLTSLSSSGNQFVFQLSGQAPGRYALHNSSNLTTWTPVSTNVLASDTLNLTNVITPGVAQKYWRAVWLP
jgi:alpha-L-arabinofuranosidase